MLQIMPESFRRSLPGEIQSRNPSRKDESQKRKNRIMEAFASGEIQVLVSTTVVEVGVNVPNATVMMVEKCRTLWACPASSARGRVGRGEHQSYCILSREIMKKILLNV